MNAEPRRRQAAKLRCAVVGTGRPPEGSHTGIGYSHAEAYLRAGLDLRAGIALSPASVEAFRSRFGAPESGLDLREVLGRTRPDVVSIATFADSHLEVVVAAIECGARAIWCEKPFTLTIGEAREVAARCREAEVLLVVNHIRRHFDGIRRARTLIEAGAIGELLSVEVTGGGWNLLGWGTHWVDVIRDLAGDPPARSAFGQVRAAADRFYGDRERGFGSPVEAAGVLYLELENGVRGLVEGGAAADSRGVIRAIGSEGMIDLSDEHGLRWYCREGSFSEPVEAAVRGPDKGRAVGKWCDAVLADLLAWLDGGPEPATGLSSALATTEAMLAGYESALRGDRVDLPFEGSASKFALESIVDRQVGDD